MKFGERHLVYRVKWIQYDNVELPSKVVLLKKDSSKKSKLVNNIYFLNKTEHQKNLSISDILHKIFKYKVYELYFERSCLESY